MLNLNLNVAYFQPVPKTKIFWQQLDRVSTGSRRKQPSMPAVLRVRRSLRHLRRFALARKYPTAINSIPRRSCPPISLKTQLRLAPSGRGTPWNQACTGTWTSRNAARRHQPYTPAPHANFKEYSLSNVHQLEYSAKTPCY